MTQPETRNPRPETFLSMKKLLLFLIAVLFVPVAAQAQTAGAFARIGFGARGIAMGGAQVADAFGDASPYYNPSLAPFTAQQSLSATAAFLTLDRELQYLQFATPLQPRAGIAAGLTQASPTSMGAMPAATTRTPTRPTSSPFFSPSASRPAISWRSAWASTSSGPTTSTS